MALFRMIILFLVIQTSYQQTYECNPNAVCGCSSNPATLSRIVGGEDGDISTWNWAVSLSMSNTYICGGTILSNSWIITAAHCVYDHPALSITVHAGSNLAWSGNQIRKVSQVIIHSQYNHTSFQNDIALLKLSSPLNMSDSTIKPICLASVNSTKLTTDEWPPANTTVVAVGWGRLHENGPHSDTLQQVTLQTIDHQKTVCRVIIKDTQVQFCAGVPDGSKDTCQGDSGGPLMMFTESKQWVLVGLTSFGEGCARISSAGVYTRIAAFENWIKMNINDAHWLSRVIPVSHALPTTDTSSSFITTSIESILQYLFSRRRSTIPDNRMYSHANILKVWNYHTFLCVLLLFFFHIVF